MILAPAADRKLFDKKVNAFPEGRGHFLLKKWRLGSDDVASRFPVKLKAQEVANA